MVRFLGMRAGWISKMVKNFKAAEAENNMHIRSLLGSSGLLFWWLGLQNWPPPGQS